MGSDSPGSSPGSRTYYLNALGSLLNLSEPQFHHQRTSWFQELRTINDYQDLASEARFRESWFTHSFSNFLLNACHVNLAHKCVPSL